MLIAEPCRFRPAHRHRLGLRRHALACSDLAARVMRVRLAPPGIPKAIPREAQRFQTTEAHGPRLYAVPTSFSHCATKPPTQVQASTTTNRKSSGVQPCFRDEKC